MSKLPLWKELDQVSRDNFWASDEDRWAAILRTIAARSSDWMDHATEDDSVTEDIAHWFTYEAEVAEAPPLPVPSLKQLALEALERCPGPVKDIAIIRRAIDSLNDADL